MCEKDILLPTAAGVLADTAGEVPGLQLKPELRGSSGSFTPRLDKTVAVADIRFSDTCLGDCTA